MAFYENPSDMHQKRADNCKKNGDRYYAQAMEAKAAGNKEQYQTKMAQAKTQYKMRDENLAKVERDKGKTWK